MAYHVLRHGTPRFGQASESGVDHFPLTLCLVGRSLVLYFLMFCFIFALLVLLGGGRQSAFSSAWAAEINLF